MNLSNTNKKKSEVSMNANDIETALNMFYGLRLDEDQKVFRDMIWDESKRIIFCNAKAGTGKTTIAVGMANLLYQSGKYDNILYIISPTQEQRQGFLPGDSEAKSAPYMEPLYEALMNIGVNPIKAVVSSQDMTSQKNGEAYIKAIPHTYLRGSDIGSKTVVILDETQNFYTSDLKKTLTRIHDTCKTIVIGHTGQIDLYKNPKNSGFQRAIELFKSKNDERAAFCELTINHRGWVSSVADELESEIRL